MPNNPFAKRYAPAIESAARQIARELPAALDAEVVRQLGEAFATDAAQTGEALSLAGYLARWRRRALVQWIFAAPIIGASSLASFLPAPYQQIGAASAIGAGFYFSCEARRQRREISPILEAFARIQAAQSARALLDLWGTTAPLGNGSQPQPAPQERPMLPPETIKLFDWGELKRDPDGYPNLLVVGASGSGKTYSTERILSYLGTPTKVITTKRKPSQWNGLEVIGTPRDFEAIAEAFQVLTEEMESRMANLGREWEQQWVVVDELPAIAANVADTQRYLTTFIREARETRLRFAFLVQGRQVKTIGLEGQSDLRDNLTEILLGKFAVQRARELVGKRKAPQSLLDWCLSQSRPILVGDSPALCP